jgi:hypothetical protein
MPALAQIVFFPEARRDLDKLRIGNQLRESHKMCGYLIVGLPPSSGVVLTLGD